MAIKFEKIKAGMTIWDVRKNTDATWGKWSIWPVYIISVDAENRTVLASWNYNTPEKMRESRVTKFRAKKPDNK